jgi:hypothetical protein
VSGTKSDDQKKPDLRDNLPGRESGGVSDAEFVGDEPARSSGNGPDITKPGVFKHPAGQTTQE